MISELSFARKFTAFWNQLIPGCEAYVRLINKGLMKRVETPIEFNERSNNRALINSMGFRLFSSITKNEISLKEVKHSIGRTKHFNIIVKKEIAFLSRFLKGTKPQIPFLDSEIDSILAIANRLVKRYRSCGEVKIEPLFDGCGILNSVEGDLWVDDVLVEIKAGERNFSVYDIRQLLIYCAVNYYSKNKYHIEEVELFNPRMGVFFRENINILSKNIGSMSSTELFSEIITFLSQDDFIQEI